MQTKATKATRKPARKIATRKKTASALSTCPTGGAGWCSYPFSATQLEKRLKGRSQNSQDIKPLEPVGTVQSNKAR